MSSSPRIFESVPFRLPIGERTASTISASDIGDSIDPALPHAFERLKAAVLELDPGASDEVPDGRGDEHLPRSGERRDPRAGVHRDPRDLLTEQLAFAGVQARAELQAEVARRLANSHGAADRTGRAVKGGEEAVAGSIDIVAPEADALVARHGVK